MKKLTKDNIKDNIKDKDIILAEEGLVSNFCYELINSVLGFECLFISNDSLITDFYDEDDRDPEDVQHIFEKIEKHYDISMADYDAELYIYKVANFVAMKLDIKELG